MEKQLEYYDETGKSRDEFDAALPGPMGAYSSFRKQVYKNGALSVKNKRLIALAVGLHSGCTRCIQGQAKDAVVAGATKEEVLEAASVAIVMGGTHASSETWRIVEVLKELGKW